MRASSGPSCARLSGLDQPRFARTICRMPAVRTLREDGVASPMAGTYPHASRGLFTTFGSTWKEVSTSVGVRTPPPPRLPPRKTAVVHSRGALKAAGSLRLGCGRLTNALVVRRCGCEVALERPRMKAGAVLSANPCSNHMERRSGVREIQRHAHGAPREGALQQPWDPCPPHLVAPAKTLDPSFFWRFHRTRRTRRQRRRALRQGQDQGPARAAGSAGASPCC